VELSFARVTFPVAFPTGIAQGLAWNYVDHGLSGVRTRAGVVHVAQFSGTGASRAARPALEAGCRVSKREVVPRAP
jgi:hypothetical protein